MRLPRQWLAARWSRTSHSPRVVEPGQPGPPALLIAVVRRTSQSRSQVPCWVSRRRRLPGRIPSADGSGTARGRSPGCQAGGASRGTRAGPRRESCGPRCVQGSGGNRSSTDARIWHVELKREVSLTAWRAPAHQEAVYASGNTPMGSVILTRRPGDRGHAESAAEAREDWAVTLQSGQRLEVHGLAAPGFLVRKRLRGGVAGSLDGQACRVAVSSAYFWPKRSVCLQGDSVELAFTTRGLAMSLMEDGEMRGVRRGGGWEFSASTAPAILAACLFEWAEMAYFLRTPGLRLL